MEPKNLFVGLDIGTTKIVAMAGSLNEYNKIHLGKINSYSKLRFSSCSIG